MRSNASRGMRRALPRDAVEWLLLRRFEALLDTAPIGAMDDFEAMGGDSVRAAELFQWIAEEFGAEFPLTTLLKAGTPRALADVVRDYRARETCEASVALNDAVGAPPIFVIPGAGGDAYAAHELARGFGGRRPVHGLRYPGLDGTSPYVDTVEEIAGHFAPAVLAAAAGGPVMLVGCSFGGVVAFELARRLRADGVKIGLLALIDSFAPGYPPAPGGVRGMLARVLGPLDLRPVGGDLRGVRRFLRHRLAHLRLLVSTRVAGVRFADRFVYLREAASRARRRYRPKPLAVDAVVLRMSELRPREPRDTLLGWGEWICGRIVRAEFDGRHGDYLRAPLADRVAEWLEAHAEDACAPPPSPEGVPR